MCRQRPDVTLGFLLDRKSPVFRCVPMSKFLSSHCDPAQSCEEFAGRTVTL